MAQSVRDVTALLGRYSRPEKEFSVPWIEGTTVKSPSAIRTDRIISFLLIHWRGRISTINATFAPVPDAVRYLLQEIRVYGQHASFGSQVPLKLRAKTINDINIMNRFTYAPMDVLVGGAVGTVTDSDLDVFWTVPLFPSPLSLGVAPLYSLKGPDWAGNLYVEADCGEQTVLGALAANTTFTAYGLGTGHPELRVSVIRPLVTVDLMNRISPAIPFRTYQIIDNVVQGATFNRGKIVDLHIGKRTVAVIAQTGTLQAGLAANQRSYAAFSDAIVTNMYPAIDGKPIFDPHDGESLREWSAYLGGQVFAAGYKEHSFQRESGNPDSGFPAETLTAARRFELDGDVTGAANQGCEIVQEELLGSPAIF